MALRVFIYVNYCFITYLVMIFARSINFGISPMHVIYAVPAMLAIFLPLRFFFLFERSLKIVSRSERLYFYLSLLWIGVAASLSLYLA